MSLWALVSWLLLTAAVSAEELRVWQDDTGNFRVLASLLERTPEGVKLKKSDGIEVTVSWSKLSAKDQAYVAQKFTAPVAPPQFQPSSVGEMDADQEVFVTREGGVSDQQVRAILKKLGPERIVVIVVGFILSLGAGLVFVVRAFQESIWWGLGALFIPIVSLFFLLFHWRRAWPSTFVSLLGLGMMAAAIWSADGAWEQLRPLLGQWQWQDLLFPTP